MRKNGTPELSRRVRICWVETIPLNSSLAGNLRELAHGGIPRHLLRRLAAVGKPLDGTRFSFSEDNAYVEVTCPWGNRMRCFAPGERFGQMMLGMPYVELEVPRGTDLTSVPSAGTTEIAYG